MANESDNKEPRRVVELPAFDPTPSAHFACEVLTEAGVPFALIGRVAMWALMPPETHEFTKDVDFAVPASAIEPLKTALSKRGVVPRDLSIGGLAVRKGELRVDFIHRSEGGLDSLFEEAIAQAQKGETRAKVAGIELPVVTPEYLVALKVVSAELRDQQDAISMLRVLPEIDIQRTRRIIFHHGGPGSANLFDTLARQAGRPEARPEYRNSG